MSPPPDEEGVDLPPGPGLRFLLDFASADLEPSPAAAAVPEEEVLDS